MLCLERAVIALALLSAGCGYSSRADAGAGDDPPPAGDRGVPRAAPTGEHLTVTVRLQDEEFVVEDVQRVRYPLRRLRGIRERRGIWVEARDPSGTVVHRAVLTDPRERGVEVSDEQGNLRRVPVSASMPHRLVLKIPADTEEVRLYDASQGGAWAGRALRGHAEPGGAEERGLPLLARLSVKGDGR